MSKQKDTTEFDNPPTAADPTTELFRLVADLRDRVVALEDARSIGAESDKPLRDRVDTLDNHVSAVMAKFFPFDKPDPADDATIGGPPLVMPAEQSEDRIVDKLMERLRNQQSAAENYR